MPAHPTRRRRATTATSLPIDLWTAPAEPISTPKVPAASRPEKTSAHGNETLRRAIARQAARLIDEGQIDYQAAKVKAAKALGAESKGHNALPDNAEIEAALREHQALFAGETRLQALDALRKAACQSMHWLADFEPWLTGGVLNGTANEYSAVELELIGVEAKSFELFLLGEDVDFDICSRQTHRAGRRDRHSRKRSFKPQDVVTAYAYEFFFDDAPVEITIYDSHAERQAKHPRNSVKYERAQLTEFLRRLNASRRETESLISAGQSEQK